MAHAVFALMRHVDDAALIASERNGFTLTDVGQRDVLWRRSKLGLHLAEDAQQAVTDWFAARD